MTAELMIHFFKVTKVSLRVKGGEDCSGLRPNMGASDFSLELRDSYEYSLYLCCLTLTITTQEEMCTKLLFRPTPSMLQCKKTQLEERRRCYRQ